jgi:flagellar assembly factor FliW
VITLPMGLPGFPAAKTFVLLDHKPGSVFRWLQALEIPELAFVVIDPLAWKPEFPLDAVRRSASIAGIDPDEELVVLVVCTVPPPPDEPTANFLAPIGIGRESRRGAQVVLHDSGMISTEPFLRSRR